MPLTRLAAATVSLPLVLGLALSAQTLNPPPREVIKQARNLSEAEVSAILDAARRAVDGRTFKISYTAESPGPEIQMGSDGRPRLVRMVHGEDSAAAGQNPGDPAVRSTTHKDIETRMHYTRQPARGCDGSARDGELVLEYENDGSGWKVTARTRSEMEVNGAMFDMMAGAVPLTAGDAQQVGDRNARPLTAPFKLPEGVQGGPPPGTTMSLWLDTESLLPLRWTLAVPASPAQGIPAIPDFGIVLTYLESADLQPPADVPAPNCIR